MSRKMTRQVRPIVGLMLASAMFCAGGVAVVVIDDNQIVRGVVPWDGRTSVQRRNDLDAALRGTPLRRSAPDHPADAANPPSP